MFSPSEMKRLQRVTIWKRHPPLELLDRLPGFWIVPRELVPWILTGVVAIAVGALAAAIAHSESAVGYTTIEHDFAFLGGSSSPKSAEQAHLPLLRDYTLFGIMVITALTVPQMLGQWRRLASLPKALADARLFREDGVESAAVVGAFEALSRRSNRWRHEILALVLAVLVVVGVWRTTSSGIYPFFDHAARQVHYDYWWCNWDVHKRGALLFFGLVGFYSFLQIRHNIMGYHMLRLLADLHTAAPQGQGDRRGWLGYTDPWYHVGNPVAPLATALVDVFKSIVLGMLVLLMAVYTLEFPSVVVFLILVYAVYNVAVVIVPWVYLNRQLVLGRDALHFRLLDELRTELEKGSDATDAKVTQLQIACDRLLQLPDRVLGTKWITVMIFTYLIPVVGIIRS
jgi:hypothetical protein